ncbi:hypothetical protein JTB14_036591 [Gonioctena quinquepunctata]|nr:hypothetical protein JTB14_036591 [Gonioctena quinquepunctata]
MEYSIANESDAVEDVISLYRGSVEGSSRGFEESVFKYNRKLCGCTTLFEHSKSLPAFTNDDTMRIKYDNETRPCVNKKLLSVLSEKYGYKYHRKIHLGGSGHYNTFILVLNQYSSIPPGVKQWWLTRAMRAGLDSLEADCKTLTHGIPRSDLYDGTQKLTLYSEDASLVFRRIDAFIKEKQIYASAVEKQGLVETVVEQDFKYYKLTFLYYRC